MKLRRILPAAVLALLSFAAFGGAFRNGFTNWDDPAYITENRLIRKITTERIARAFTTFHLQNYNPLQLVSYMVDHALWGLEPRGFLLSSLLIHTATGVLIFRILLELGRSSGTALFAAAVFLIHPTRCESVVWLSERKDVLSGLFAMAALLWYLKACKREPSRGTAASISWEKLSLSIFLYLLALLSKGQVVTLPLVLLALDLYRRRPHKHTFLALAPYLFLSAGFSWVTLKAHAPDQAAILGQGSLGGISILRPFEAIPHYLAAMFFPWGLSPYYPRSAGGAMSPTLWLTGFLALSLVACGTVQSFKGSRAFLAGAAWFFFFLLPVSGLVPNQVLVADRYLYLAIVGPAWLVAELTAGRLPAFPSRAASILACGLLALLTIQYSSVWRDSESLWRRVLERAPDSPLAQANLGMHLLEKGRVPEARRLFEEDLRGKPFLRESFFGLAEIHRMEGRLDDARRVHERLLEASPLDPDVAIRFAGFLAETGRAREALEFLETRSLRPTFSLHQAFFRIHFELGRLDLAHRHSKISTALNPFHEEGWYHLGLIDEKMGRSEEARSAYGKAIDCDEPFPKAREALALLEFRDGKPAMALRALEGARERTGAWWNLRALALHELGDLDQSLEAIREAVRLEPRNARHWANRSRMALRATRRREAESSLRAALELEPALAEALDPELKRLHEGPLSP